MSWSEWRGQVIYAVQIRCQRCADNHPRSGGKGTILGSMVLMPNGDSERWGFVATRRWRSRDPLFHGGRRAMNLQTTEEVQFNGGVELQCVRSSHHRPRAKVANLADLAADARARDQPFIHI